MNHQEQTKSMFYDMSRKTKTITQGKEIICMLICGLAQIGTVFGHVQCNKNMD